MGRSLVSGIQFNEDFQDKFISRREAKGNSIDPQLRAILNSPECANESCYRVTEEELRSYIAAKKADGLYNLLILQGESGTSLFSPRANEFLHHGFMQAIEHHLPEVDVMARDEHSFQFKYQEQIFVSLSDKEATRIEMVTGFSPERSGVRKIRFFHDMMIDTAGVYLAVSPENQAQFMPTLQQIVKVGQFIPQLHEQGYSLDEEAIVHQKDRHYVKIQAYRWRKEGEDPTDYEFDEEGNEVASDIQRVVLTFNTVTASIVREDPGSLGA